MAVDSQSLFTRSAGVLAHISSIPGPYGIGDLGPGARGFTDLLYRTKQSIWQILPLTPTEKSTGYSPYSSCSGMAGNPLLISPDLLEQSGWISRRELKRFVIDSTTQVNFDLVAQNKRELLSVAFTNFKKSKRPGPMKALLNFRRRQKHWLQDFALYIAIKEAHSDLPWYDWPKQFKNRNAVALQKFESQNREKINEIIWTQFVFQTQWNDLRAYCNERGIRLLGDLPFYVSADSADVWADRNLFRLDAAGRPTEVAGVPPDYFNADGQRWGMPVFRWDRMKKQRYDWWTKRIRRNLEWTDIIRIDHFRAFSAYWSIPGDQKTAKGGRWMKGPGASFFDQLRSEFVGLPFLAEDLGDIDDDVHSLRDNFSLPGMKVLQFAFGGNASTSIYMPHNYRENFAVYTGTHDNNTTKGWYRRDAGREEKENLHRYLSSAVTEKNVHQKLIELAYSSVAKMAIIPLQDILGLDEKSRMNTPASVKNNWGWRCTGEQLDEIDEKKLADLTTKYNRIALAPS